MSLAGPMTDSQPTTRELFVGGGNCLWGKGCTSMNALVYRSKETSLLESRHTKRIVRDELGGHEMPIVAPEHYIFVSTLTPSASSVLRICLSVATYDNTSMCCLFT